VKGVKAKNDYLSQDHCHIFSLSHPHYISGTFYFSMASTYFVALPVLSITFMGLSTRNYSYFLHYVEAIVK
jgi:hypothetical protein